MLLNSFSCSYFYLWIFSEICLPIFCPFSYWIALFLPPLLCFESSSCDSILCWICSLWIFSTICSLYFHYLPMVFYQANVLNSEWSLIYQFPFFGSCFWCQVTTLWLTLGPREFLPFFSLKVLPILCFALNLGSILVNFYIWCKCLSQELFLFCL